MYTSYSSTASSHDRTSAESSQISSCDRGPDLFFLPMRSVAIKPKCLILYKQNGSSNDFGLGESNPRGVHVVKLGAFRAAGLAYERAFRVGKEASTKKKKKIKKFPLRRD